jgi:hypothetical protein
MREDFKDQYRSLIAVAFSASQDLGRAQARLSLLADPDPFRALAAQAQHALAEGAFPGEARALGELADAIGPGIETAGSVTPDGSPSPPPSGSPLPTNTPSAGATSAAATSPTSQATLIPSPTLTRTPLPTRTPTPTPGLPFELAEQTDICDPALDEALIKIYAEDVDGNPVPGVALLVSWPDAEEQIFTGLKPEIGLGYADFTMEEGVVYSVQIPDGGLPVTDLTAQECESPDGERYLGSWELTFKQP